MRGGDREPEASSVAALVERCVGDEQDSGALGVQPGQQFAVVQVDREAWITRIIGACYERQAVSECIPADALEGAAADLGVCLREGTLHSPVVEVVRHSDPVPGIEGPLTPADRGTVLAVESALPVTVQVAGSLGQDDGTLEWPPPATGLGDGRDAIELICGGDPKLGEGRVERQPASLVGAIDSSVDLIPDLTPDLILDLIPDLTQDLTPDLTQDLSPDLTPDLILDLTPDLIPDLILDLTQDLTQDLSPDLTPDLTQDLTQDLTPDLSPDLTPDLILDLILDLIPDLSEHRRADRAVQRVVEPDDDLRRLQSGALVGKADTSLSCLAVGRLAREADIQPLVTDFRQPSLLLGRELLQHQSATNAHSPANSR